MIYAQLDSNNICIAVSILNSEIHKENMVQLNEYDTSLLGKKYNKGVFEEVVEK